MSSRPLSFTSDSNRVDDVLAHQYRRAALSTLIEQNERMALDDLAEYVAMEAEPAGNIKNGELIRQIAIQLHHTHLPKLEDAGLVEYDAVRHRTVRATSTGHDLGILVPEERPFNSR